MTLRSPDDVVVFAGSARRARAARSGELVFVGYGAAAPEYKWDDFKGMDLKGKILLVLVNDPPATAAEPKLFGGKAMTYYGRWTYKYEEAERRGAAGVLIVHTTESASYPWHTVVGSWSGEQRMLPRDASSPPPLGMRGWITDSAATRCCSRARGSTWRSSARTAESRDFKPVSTGITIDFSARNSVQAPVERERRRRRARARREAQERVRRAQRALGSPRNRRAGERRLDLQRRGGQRVSGVASLLAVARAAAKLPDPAPLADLPLRHRRRIRAARLAVLRRASRRCPQRASSRISTSMSSP